MPQPTLSKSTKKLARPKKVVKVKKETETIKTSELKTERNVVFVAFTTSDYVQFELKIAVQGVRRNFSEQGAGEGGANKYLLKYF